MRSSPRRSQIPFGTISRKALVKDAEELGRVQELPHNITEINSGNSGEFTREVYAIKDDSLRVEVWVHDATSNSMVKIFSNNTPTSFKGKYYPGVTIGHLKTIIANGASRGLRKHSPVEGIGRIDYYKMWIHEKNPSGEYERHTRH